MIKTFEIDEQSTLKLFPPYPATVRIPGPPLDPLKRVSGILYLYASNLLPFLHIFDSSPREAKANLVSVITLALLDRPVTPVGVWVSGKITAGLE